MHAFTTSCTTGVYKEDLARAAIFAAVFRQLAYVQYWLLHAHHQGKDCCVLLDIYRCCKVADPNHGAGVVPIDVLATLRTGMSAVLTNHKARYRPPPLSAQQLMKARSKPHPATKAMHHEPLVRAQNMLCPASELLLHIAQPVVHLSSVRE